jgi:MSHA biogenesis protein MshK
MNALAAGFLLATCAANAFAQQGLADPTRPPVLSPAAVSDAPAPAAHRLQSVLLSSGRKVAVIDGKTVALGGRLGDATLVRLSETEAVLRSGKDLTRLRLHPDVEKKTVRAGSANRAAPGAATGENRR